METKTFAKLNNPINTGGGSILDELKVSVDYQKGGINHFYGTLCESGVYVYLIPTHRERGFCSQIIMGQQHSDGYKILLKELNRKSQKQINLMAEKIIPHSQEIADLYSEYKHREVYELVKKLIE